MGVHGNYACVFIYIFWPSSLGINLLYRLCSLFHPMQLFFDDSARNIASGKAAGLNTVIVSYNLLFMNPLGKF